MSIKERIYEILEWMVTLPILLWFAVSMLVTVVILMILVIPFLTLEIIFYGIERLDK